jgi:hypothetical protein
VAIIKTRGGASGGSISFASIVWSKFDGSFASAKLSALGPPRHRLPAQQNATALRIARQGQRIDPNPDRNLNQATETKWQWLG